MLLALVLCLGLLPAAAVAAETFTQVTSQEQFTTGQYYMLTDTGYAPGMLDGTWVSAVAAADAPSGAVWTLTVTGKEVTLQDANGKFIAPKGGNNNGIQEEEYSWSWTFEDGKFVFSGQGDDTVHLASNKGSQNKFRGYKTTTVEGNPSGYPYQFTLYKLDSQPAVTVAAPQAQPQSGAVEAGTEITLTTATAGASIYYTLDGSEPTEKSTLYSDSSKPAITANCTLKAVAILGGSSSAVQTLTYTIAGETAAPIAHGDQVVIYNPAYGKALSSTRSGYYNAGVDVAVQDGVVTDYGAAEVWTVIDNKDGTWSFSNGGQNIGMDDSFTSMPQGGKHDHWALEDAGDGLYYICNTGRDAYMEWYAEKNYWSAYHSINTGSEGLFQLAFYHVTEDLPDDPEPAGAPFEPGDSVVVYGAENHLALSATVKNTYYPVGVKVEVTPDSITGYSGKEVWLVGGDAEDGFTFGNGGKTLSMAGSYSSTYPGAGEHETWALEAAGEEGEYYLKNLGRETYLFWDTEYEDWTTRSGEKTAVSFRVVEAPEEEPDVTGLSLRANPASGATVARGDTIELSAADGVEIYYTTDGTTPTTSSAKYVEALTVGDDVAVPTAETPLVIRAVGHRPAGENGEETGMVYTFTYKAATDLDDYALYFGQLHSHTNISDGAGSVGEAFAHAALVDNLDFLAVTDHSNSFDGESDSRVDLGVDCTEISSEWAQGHRAAQNATTEDFVGIYGFDMTWSDGFGHINTFNTPGFESRSNSEFGNRSGSTEGYRNYYDKLVEVSSSLSQFNHPGTTFGDFQDFAFYDAAIDQRITLIEVGNGEGAIGSSGYFPSYEYYTRALDKGWHVAPTNNQDNHKGNWGDSNTARSVVLATALTEDAIYDAIANYRVYATEDSDLSICYALNGNAMGSILPKQATVTITAQISDPTDHDDAKVEVIVNGGLVADSQTLSGCNGTITFTFDSNDYSYYYLRVTQADQHIAVTAPVWTGEGVNAGISSTSCDTALVVKGEAVELSAALYNNAGKDMSVKSLTFSVEGETIHTVPAADIGQNGVLASGGAQTVSFSHAFSATGSTTVDVTLVAQIGATEHTFSGVLRLSVTDPSLVTRILVDGTHYNDYVTGYYSGNMGNFTALAAEMNAQVTIAQPGETITKEDLADVALFVVPAPLKTERDGHSPTVFSEEFIAMVADYAKGGGTVILTGLADYQDNFSGAPYCSTEQINPILVAMGATMRLHDDEVLDDDPAHNGGESQTYRVYMDDFNTTAFPALFEGLQEGQVYSAYSGCSIDLGENGQAIVRGSENCYSINSNDRPANAKGQWDSGKPKGSTASGSYNASTAVVTKGNVVTLATEAVGSGRVYLAGTVFLSDFEISDSSSVDYGDASYANKVIARNIVASVQKEQAVSTIAQVRANKTVGAVFTVEGTVTAGNVEPNAFYDTIYIQDATGGINIYPVATSDGTFQVGQKVRVTGSWDQYQGDTELRCIDIETIDEAVHPLAPTALSIQAAADYDENGGLLAKVVGTVTSVTKQGEAISSVVLSDGTHSFRLLFNNYIGYSDETSPDITTFVKEGAEISAVGVIYMDPDGVCLRVRDLSEVEETGGGAEPSVTYRVTVVGSYAVASGEGTYESGETVSISAGTRPGYRFLGWRSSDVALENAADADTSFVMPAKDVTVTATWRKTETTPVRPSEPTAPSEPESPEKPEEPAYTDVAAGSWYEDAVAYVTAQGLMTGVGNGRFNPDGAVTRAMVWTVLARMAGEDTDGGATWYSKAQIWAMETGVSDGTKPMESITREQLAAMLYRFEGSPKVSGNLSAYPDGNTVSDWAADAMVWATETGLINGINGYLKPQSGATRAQLATMLMRFTA